MAPSIAQVAVNASIHIDQFTQNLDVEAKAILTQFHALFSATNLGVCRRHKHYDLHDDEVIFLTKHDSEGGIQGTQETQTIYKTAVLKKEDLPTPFYPVSWFWMETHGWVPAVYSSIRPAVEVNSETLAKIDFAACGFDTQRFGLMVKYMGNVASHLLLREDTYAGRKQVLKFSQRAAHDDEKNRNIVTVWFRDESDDGKCNCNFICVSSEEYGHLDDHYDDGPF